MALAVDALQLGQIGTNCYLVRADRSATEAVVVDPGADAAEIRLELARTGATCAAILLTHSHYDHFGALADLAEGTGAPVLASRRRARRLPAPAGLLPRHPDARVRGRGEAPLRRRDRRGGGHVLPGAVRPRPLAGAPRLLRRRLPVLGRRPLRRLASAAPICRSATGTRCSSRSARSSTRIRPKRSSTPGTGRRRRSAPSSPATRSSPSLRDVTIERPRGTHDILPSEQPLWRRVTDEMERLCALAGYRRIQTPVFEDTDLFARTSGQGARTWFEYVLLSRGVIAWDGISTTIRTTTLKRSAAIPTASCRHQRRHRGPQRVEPLSEHSLGVGTHGDMAELAAGARFLAVVVQVGAGHREHACCDRASRRSGSPSR